MATVTATKPDAPEDLAATLRLEVTRLARLMRQQSDAPLTPTQLSALATIARSGPLPIGQLAELEQIGAPTATKVVDKLCSSHYVERRSDDADRRVTQISITAAGERLLTDVRARKTAWLTSRVASLSSRDRAQLAQLTGLLERLTAAPRGPDSEDAT